MNAMLVTMFVFAGLGMLATRYRIRLYPAAILVGTLLTAVYLFLPRYM
jgi:hypothetical protein